MNGKRILAVTLARGGSKGVPRKNLVPINDKALIDYTLDEAKKSRLITRYIVSTDDKEIQEHVLRKDIEAPFLRPKHLASDTATSADALKHALLFCEKEEQLKYDLVIELMCTNPFKDHKDIDNCINLFFEKSADSVIGVNQLEEYHPARAKKLIDGYINDFCVEENSSRRQDLTPKAFIRNGSIYAISRDKLVNDNYRFGGDNSIGYIMPSHKSINVDSQLDVLLCDLLMKNPSLVRNK